MGSPCGKLSLGPSLSDTVTRLLELLLGLPRGFLAQEGELALRFYPLWPWQDVVGAAVWNLALLGASAWLIAWVYRRDARQSRQRLLLGSLRFALVLLVVLLLNRPVVQLTQSRVEPSVVAVLVDDSVSMTVADEAGGRPRLTAAVERLVGPMEGEANGPVAVTEGPAASSAAGLLERLARDHVVRVYRFGGSPSLLGIWDGPAGEVAGRLRGLRAASDSTAVAASAAAVAEDLVGQRLAGLVVVTDGRDAPTRAGLVVARAGLGGTGGDPVMRLREAGIKVFGIEVGSDRPPRNLLVQNVVLEEAAFKGDLVGIRVSVSGSGFPAAQPVRVRLLDARTGGVLPGVSRVAGATTQAIADATLDADGRAEVELILRPAEVGNLELVAEVSAADQQPGEGEIDAADNRRLAYLTVLDTELTVLYVEGYPRWDYRFLRTELIRDRSIEVSILLTSAEEGFAQEGNRPIRRFPETMDELLPFDVVILGDVDPRQFTDAQLELLAEFVGSKGGGLMMVAGPRHAPWAYRGSAIEPVLPVAWTSAGPDAAVGLSAREAATSGRAGDRDRRSGRVPGASLRESIGLGNLTVGFRPIVTSEGLRSGVFRFFADPEVNEQFLRNDLQMLFWFARGIVAKPGLAEVLAEHPTELGPDGRKAPLLVAGRYGAGRTLFSAVDESWRFRYYTGESVFDTYWVQQIRLLARGRKLGQRAVTVQAVRPVVELGELASVVVRVLDSNLLRQLPERLEAERLDPSGQVVGRELLTRQEDRPDTFIGQWRADRVGRTIVRLTSIAPGVDGIGAGLNRGRGESGPEVGQEAGLTTAYDTVIPRLELADPRPDRAALARLAAETGGESLPLAAAAALPERIVSAAKVIPVETSKPVWDAPLAMLLFALLITAEWVLRKIFGMI